MIVQTWKGFKKWVFGSFSEQNSTRILNPHSSAAMPHRKFDSDFLCDVVSCLGKLSTLWWPSCVVSVGKIAVDFPWGYLITAEDFPYTSCLIHTKRCENVISFCCRFKRGKHHFAWHWKCKGLFVCPGPLYASPPHHSNLKKYLLWSSFP